MVFLLPIFSGLLLVFSYPPYNVKFLPLIALIPLLTFIDGELNKKKIFRNGFLTGLIFFGGILRWFLAAHPLDWIGIKNIYLSFVLTMTSWLVTTAFLALFVGFFCLTFSRLKTNSWFDLFLAPSLWIIFEYLRAWGFNFLNLGPGTLFGAHYTLGDLGYSLVNQNNFLQLASIGGVLGLSFLIVFINFWIFRIFKNGFRKINLISLVLFLIFLILINFYGFYLKAEKENHPNKEINIASIQTNFSSQFHYTSQERRQIYLTYLQLTKEATTNSSNPQIIVLPEDSRFFNLFKKEDIDAGKRLIITSGRLEDVDGKIKSIMTYYDTQKGVVAKYQKKFLMPVGEYLPYWLNGLAQLSGKKDWVEEFSNSRGYTKGNELIIAKTDWGKIGGLICSGVLSSELNRELINKGAELLVLLSSNGPFRGNKLLLSQILAIARVRAVENNRYIIQSANKGWSYIIDTTGRIKAGNFTLGEDVVYGKISFISEKTFYTKYGDWILITALCFTIIAIFFKNLNSNKLS